MQAKNSLRRIINSAGRNLVRPVGLIRTNEGNSANLNSANSANLIKHFNQMLTYKLLSQMLILQATEHVVSICRRNSIATPGELNMCLEPLCVGYVIN